MARHKRSTTGLAMSGVCGSFNGYDFSLFRKGGFLAGSDRQQTEIYRRTEISDHLPGISMTRCGVPSDVFRGDRPLDPAMHLICRRMGDGCALRGK